MKNLLLVDDEKIFLRSLSEGLGAYLNSDVRVVTAENGEEAFRILSSVPVSLVVTDLKMPIMNGVELVSHMRESGFDIPVIVMSALLGGGEEGKLRSLGVSQFLEKPLDIEDLARLITEQLFDNYSTPPKGPSSSVPAIQTGWAKSPELH